MICPTLRWNTSPRNLLLGLSNYGHINGGDLVRHSTKIIALCIGEICCEEQQMGSDDPRISY